VSRYDDPRWYEEQPDQHNQPPFPGQPAQPSFEDFDHYPFLPTPENLPQQQANGTGQIDQQKPPRRLQRVLGQILLTLALIVIAFLGGWFAHQYFGNTFDLGNQSRSYSQMIQQAWTDIDQNYVDRKAVNYQKMSYAAINAMVTTLGDTGHSRFMDPKTVQSENQQLSGTFTGIGIYLHQDTTTKQLIVTAPIPNSPAEKAGLKPGDIIKSINGTDMTGKDTNAASGLIQGTAGTTVTLVIQRPGEVQTRTFKIVRAEIDVPNVFMHYIAESHIADIQVVQFATGVSNDVRKAIGDAKAKGATKIILDLRDNPGGYLDEATNMSSLFIKSGNVLLEQDSTGQRTPYAVSGNSIDTTSPMVVLVNRYTASAAEIVTGALKENNRAIVIGETTFGTGTVLEQFNLADGSALYLGTQEWLTPDGHFIRQVAGDPNSGGIKPNMPVAQDPNKPALTANQANESNMSQQQILDSGDAQLAAAIQYLINQK
jgi:carboxyl-terminal processing protease